VNGLTTLEISASSVAWYAAIVATVSAAVSAYNILRDRARLLIRVAANMRFLNAESPSESGLFIVVTVVNSGRRPITITHVWLEGGRKTEKLLFAGSVIQGARELTEGKWADYRCKQEGLDKQLFKYVCVTDSTGRIHRKRVARHVRRAIMQT